MWLIGTNLKWADWGVVSRWNHHVAQRRAGPDARYASVAPSSASGGDQPPTRGAELAIRGFAGSAEHAGWRIAGLALRPTISPLPPNRVPTSRFVTVTNRPVKAGFAISSVSRFVVTYDTARRIRGLAVFAAARPTGNLRERFLLRRWRPGADSRVDRSSPGRSPAADRSGSAGGSIRHSDE